MPSQEEALGRLMSCPDMTERLRLSTGLRKLRELEEVDKERKGFSTQAATA